MTAGPHDGGAATAAATTPTAHAALYRRGVICVLASALVFSLNGLIFRSMEGADAWQVLFWRGAALFVAMSCLFALRHRRRAVAEARRAWRGALLAGPLIGVASVCFIQALDHTTVANTLFTTSSVPLFAAVLAWAVLGERVVRATWVAIAVAMAGIAVMVLDGLETGTVVGNLLALTTAVLFASFVVVLRAQRHVDMLAAICVAALVTTAIGGVMAEDFTVSARDLAILLAWGGLHSCLGHTLFTYASRHVPAAELTLIGMSEMAVGPLWVWLAYTETPTALSLTGGFIVITALVGWTLSQRKRAAV